MTQPALIPELAGYRDRFEEARREAFRLVETCTPELFNMQPGAGRWSPGQCLDHLNTTGRKMVRQMADAIAEAEEHGPFSEGPFRYGFFSRFFVRSMQPDPSVRIPSPGLYKPADEPLKPEAVAQEFSALQHAFVDMTERANGLDLRRIRVASPVSRWLRFSLGAWLAAAAGHQERHLKQARDALRSVQGMA